MGFYYFTFLGESTFIPIPSYLLPTFTCPIPCVMCNYGIPPLFVLLSAVDPAAPCFAPYQPVSPPGYRLHLHSATVGSSFHRKQRL